MKPFFLLAVLAAMMFHVNAREHKNIDQGWKFAFGHTDPSLDYGCGTEYFNYLTKANSIHNTGPYATSFNDSAWVSVDLPFDFVVDLPYDGDASHSHGYKTVGYRYPATSVGWYRKHIPVEKVDSGSRFYLTFDGIFRDSRVWFNGFYLGGEPSGYTQQRYDITPYIKYGEDNLITVRSDATLEEGWFYEGGGIYRHVTLEKAPAIHNKPNSLRVIYTPRAPGDTTAPSIKVRGTLLNATSRMRDQGITVRVSLTDTDGSPVGGQSTTAISIPSELPAKGEYDWEVSLRPDLIHPWSPDSPRLYDVNVSVDGPAPDHETIRTGFRTIEFDPDRSLLINGKPVRMHGVNLHQDHAGVGVGIPDAVNIYRLKELKKYGVNTIRSSHNPMTPEVLAACDSLGMLVIEENRLLGINDYHTGQLAKMISRDFNHPSIILWSVGNEEWGVEWDPRGTSIITELRDVAHRLDPTRPMTTATSGGPAVVMTPDVAGYNYIVQNPVEQYRTEYPDRCAFGSEETTGCGTRGIYFDDRENGRMASLNRIPDPKDSTLNRIGRGWIFYRDRPWLGGLCYWTGFDYRGEPNPLKYPATGSQFGILDYCGFPKDEAYYLQAQWTDTPVLHIFPHWNLEGHEGEPVQIWAYSNLDEIELSVNGKSLGRKQMTPGGYLSWDAIYTPGEVKATGYRDGRKVMSRTIGTSGDPVVATAEKAYEKDGVSIINVTLRDTKGRFTPVASPLLSVTLPSGAILLGAGNGDPAIGVKERPVPGDVNTGKFTFPAFNGHAQFIIRNLSGIPLIEIL